MEQNCHFRSDCHFLEQFTIFFAFLSVEIVRGSKYKNFNLSIGIPNIESHQSVFLGNENWFYIPLLHSLSIIVDHTQSTRRAFKAYGTRALKTLKFISGWVLGSKFNLFFINGLCFGSSFKPRIQVPVPVQKGDIYDNILKYYTFLALLELCNILYTNSVIFCVSLTS